MQQGLAGLLQFIDQHQVQLQIRSLLLVQLFLGEVVLGVGLLAVADVAGCGSDQLVDLVRVLELGTVDLEECLGVGEQALGKAFGQLGLAGPGRAQGQQDAGGLVDLGPLALFLVSTYSPQWC